MWHLILLEKNDLAQRSNVTFSTILYNALGIKFDLDVKSVRQKVPLKLLYTGLRLEFYQYISTSSQKTL